MKRIAAFFLVAAMVLAGPTAFAEPTVTGLWQVNALADESDARIFSLEMDIEVGRVFLEAHGVVDLEGSGPVPAFGSGYFSQEGLVFYLNVGQHLMTVFMDNRFDGVVYLYGPENILVDEGTVTYVSMEM